LRFFKRESDVSKFQETLKGALNKIREELDDHKESINQNTNEIQSNYEYLCRLEMKIEKLAEKIDELSLFMNQPTSPRQDVLPLTQNEQKVFVCLYASGDGFLTYRDIAEKTGFSENLVVCYVGNLMAKGVPVSKKYLGARLHLGIEPAFRDMQARCNIVRLNGSVSNNLTL